LEKDIFEDNFTDETGKMDEGAPTVVNPIGNEESVDVATEEHEPLISLSSDLNDNPSDTSSPTPFKAII
jgi:hypothetical protein